MSCLSGLLFVWVLMSAEISACLVDDKTYCSAISVCFIPYLICAYSYECFALPAESSHLLFGFSLICPAHATCHMSYVSSGKGGYAYKKNAGHQPTDIINDPYDPVIAYHLLRKSVEAGELLANRDADKSGVCLYLICVG
jgi:hypothetical protein